MHIQGQGHSVRSRGQEKVKLKILGLGGVIMFLGSVFRQGREKMTPDHFLNGPNRTNFESRKNAEIAGNSVKNGLFRPSKHKNSVIFQHI